MTAYEKINKQLKQHENHKYAERSLDSIADYINWATQAAEGGMSMNERKLDIAKQIIKEHYNEACCGIYNSRNILNDPMNNIYNDGDLSIDICYYWSYFEVFGLSNDDFTELQKFYDSLYTAIPAEEGDT